MKSLEVFTRLGIDDPDDPLFATCWRRRRQHGPMPSASCSRRPSSAPVISPAFPWQLTPHCWRRPVGSKLRRICLPWPGTASTCSTKSSSSLPGRRPDAGRTPSPPSETSPVLSTCSSLSTPSPVCLPHRKLDIPEPISRACCSHYPASLQRHGDQRGHTDMWPAALYWQLKNASPMPRPSG